MRIELKPIGYIRSEFKKPEDLHFVCEQGISAKNKSYIIIHEEYSEGLKGLKGFSHLWVLFFLHKVKRVELNTHPGPPTIENLPKVGVFSSRSQYRPNPIGLKLVKLLRVVGNVITVEGLDGIDNTPVLDIKPFIPHFDHADNPKIPGWYRW